MCDWMRGDVSSLSSRKEGWFDHTMFFISFYFEKLDRRGEGASFISKLSLFLACVQDSFEKKGILPGEFRLFDSEAGETEQEAFQLSHI